MAGVELFKLLTDFDKSTIRLWFRFKYGAKPFHFSNEVIREYFQDTKEHNMLTRILVREEGKPDKEIARTNINPNLRKGWGYIKDKVKYRCILVVVDSDENEIKILCKKSVAL